MITKIEDSIAEVDVVKIASDLVRIPSFSFMEDQERDVAMYIYDLFLKEGIETELVEVMPGRCNVTARLPGRGGGRSLMLSGHLDTVPVYDMEDPFSGEIIEGRLHGRGSCDMKGPLAAMIAAMIGIHRSDVTLQGDLVFAGLIDEEEKGKGVEHLVLHGPKTDAAINGEPTGMQPAIGHKGLEWIKIKVLGKKVHGGRMDEGINAIVMASRIIERIYDEYMPKLNQRKHPILGCPTINVGKIQGGDQPSTVPGSCIIEIDRRWIPEENLDQVYEELEEIIKDVQKEYPGFQAEVSGMFPPGELLPHEPFCTDEKDPLIRSVQRAFERISHPYEGVTTFPAWSDAGVMSSFTDMKCIVMGPGDLALAHSGNESIDVEDIRAAALIYGYLAYDYCGA
ncbi:MAG: M20 family metallopeptidase [Clostridiales bacterium]|nr:M20 family metallopeptidase [Clostridiales bacterium]